VTVGGQAALAMWLFSPPGKRRTHERLFTAYPRGTIPNLHPEESRIKPGGDCRAAGAR